jgi:3-hydroxybutyryl-CoA dehydrogenase
MTSGVIQPTDIREVAVIGLGLMGSGIAELAARSGRRVITRDRPGFLIETLAYAQFNDAVRMFQDGYASPADIDTSMMLGCGYPRGPLQMLDETGAASVVGVLEAMHAATGDPAFAPVPLLAEYAAGIQFRSRTEHEI